MLKGIIIKIRAKKHTLPLILLCAICPFSACYDNGLREFMNDMDSHWTEILSDKSGYYSGALMGNGLIGTNLYKADSPNTYRLDIGRSDITEQRDGFNLFGKGRLAMGYFTFTTVGNVTDEKMDLSLYDAETSGTLTTDKGSIQFATYVHALENYVVFESCTQGVESAYTWNFVPYKAISPLALRLEYGGAYIDTQNDSVPGSVYAGLPNPKGYINSKGDSNPAAYTIEQNGVNLLIQPLAKDTTYNDIAKYYAVGWKEVAKGNKRRIIATVSFEDSEEQAISVALATIEKGLNTQPNKLRKAHREWWHHFYDNVAFVNIPDSAIQRFYWMQYYKFASTSGPGKPVVDLQGVWPVHDTPWPAIWANLNLQLTYCFQTKANMGEFAQPLWDALWEHRDNLQRNVTDIPGQESWTDAATISRSLSYDFYSPMPQQAAEFNSYEVADLPWTLFYWYQQCQAYGDDESMRNRLFPILKAAINMYFHIRIVHDDGSYSLPSTASPEYNGLCYNVGPNVNYDLANLRQGLKELIDINDRFSLNDPMRPLWKDFLDNLVDYSYSEETGYKISETNEFLDTTHRHFSHLMMFYPFHLIDLNDPATKAKVDLSVGRWNGTNGYSNAGKAAMLADEGQGDSALEQIRIYMEKFNQPNTLYREDGPCIETPFFVVSALHEFYLQDWGDRLRVFYGCPSEWKDASFRRMRAIGVFLVNAERKEGMTARIEVFSEKGNVCRIQTDIRPEELKITCNGKPVEYTLCPCPELGASGCCVEFATEPLTTTVLTR